MADLLTEIHLAYTDRVVIEDAPLKPALSNGILECILTGVLDDQGSKRANFARARRGRV